MPRLDQPILIFTCLFLLSNAIAILLNFAGLLCFIEVFDYIFHPEYIEYPLSKSLLSWLAYLCFGIIFSLSAGFIIFRIIQEKRSWYLCIIVIFIAVFALSIVISFRLMTILTSFITVSSLLILGSRISIKTSRHKVYKAMKRPKLYLTFFTLLPIFWYILFFSFVLRGWYKIGHIPRPYFPDPKNLGFDLHYASIVISTVLVGLSPISLIHPRLRWINSRSLNYTLLFLALNYFIWWTVLIIDPGQFREWFID